MYRNYETESDFFRHEKPIRITCTRIERDGYHNQRAILTTPVEKLRPYTLYELVIRQPVACDFRGLPLWIKAIKESFFPDVSSGVGYVDECHKPFANGCGEGCEGVEFEGSEVEVITEHIEGKMFPVKMYGFGDDAFANNLVFRNDEPYPFIMLYLNNNNEFVLCPPRKHGLCKKRVIVRKEIVIREPYTAETLGIGKSITPYVHPQKTECFETYVQGNFGGGYGYNHRVT